MEKVMSFDEINIFAKKLANYVNAGDLIALIGDLGTGKTTFSQNFAKELGVTENLKSPTFNYVLEYFSGRITHYHFYVYRLVSPEEIYEIGYEDYLNSDGVVLVEWANIIESELPKEYIEIKLEYFDENSRKLIISFIGNQEKEKELFGLC